MPRGASTVKTTSHTEINWGGIKKGAIIIGAAVVVGVVGFYAASAAASWALTQPAISAVAATIGQAAAPVMSGLSWLGGFLGHVPGIIGGFVGGVFGAGSGVAVTAAGASTVATSAGVAAAGGLGAAALMHSVPSLENIHLLDHSQTMVSTPIDVPLGAHSSELHADLATLNANAVDTSHHNFHSAEHTNHLSWDLGHHSLHLANHKVQAQQAAVDATSSNRHSLSDFLHLGGHKETTNGDHAQHEDLSAPDADVDMDDFAKSRRQPRSWKERASKNSYTEALNASGSHSAAVLANRSAAPAIAPRASEFTTALDNDRAKLDAALGEPSR
jgi:hypothetical protein